MTQLCNVSCHMGSHSVTCYPTQVNTHVLCLYLAEMLQCLVSVSSLVSHQELSRLLRLLYISYKAT